MDMNEKLTAVKNRIWIVLLTAFIAAGSAWGASTYLMPELYRSTATIMVSWPSLPNAQKDIILSSSLVKAYSALAESDSVFEGIISRLQLTAGVDEIKDRVTAKVDYETGIINITAKAEDPPLARDIILTYIESLKEQNDKLTLQVAIKTIDEPKVPLSSFSPNIPVNMALAGFGGLIAGLLLAIVLRPGRTTPRSGWKAPKDQARRKPKGKRVPDIKEKSDTGAVAPADAQPVSEAGEMTTDQPDASEKNAGCAMPEENSHMEAQAGVSDEAGPEGSAAPASAKQRQPENPESSTVPALVSEEADRAESFAAVAEIPADAAPAVESQPEKEDNPPEQKAETHLLPADPAFAGDAGMEVKKDTGRPSATPQPDRRFSLRKFPGLRLLGCLVKLSGNETESPIPLSASAGLEGECMTAVTQSLERILNPSGSVLLVTSPLHGDGKTVLSVNIGVALARMKKRILLIDCHTARPALFRICSPENRKSLSLKPIGNFQCHYIFNKIAALGIDIISDFNPPWNRMSLRDASRLSVFLKGLAKYYDLIILDGPIAGADETKLLCRLSDGAVIAADYSRLTDELLLECTKALREADSDILGIVINDIPTDTCVSEKLYG